MMRSTRGVAVQAVTCGFLLLVSGCLFDEAGGATGTSTEADGDAGDHGGSGGDAGVDEMTCLGEFERCVIAVTGEGEDPSVCEPIFEGCDDEPSYEPPAEEACYADFDACICDPANADQPWVCEEQLDACLGDIHGCIDDVDPCAEAYESCLAETDCPEDCEPLLLECEVPPDDDCIDGFDACMHDAEDPEACEPMIVDCFEPPPEEPNDECLAMFEGCIWATGDPEVCGPILDECHDGEPPVEDPCVDEYEACVGYAMESGSDPFECEDVLLYCFGDPEPVDPSLPPEPTPDA